MGGNLGVSRELSRQALIGPVSRKALAVSEMVQKRERDEWVCAGEWPGFAHFMESYGEQWDSEVPMRVLAMGSAVISINAAEFCRRKGVTMAEMEARILAGEKRAALYIEAW